MEKSVSFNTEKGSEDRKRLKQVAIKLEGLNIEPVTVEVRERISVLEAEFVQLKDRVSKMEFSNTKMRLNHFGKNASPATNSKERGGGNGSGGDPSIKKLMEDQAEKIFDYVQ